MILEIHIVTGMSLLSHDLHFNTMHLFDLIFIYLFFAITNKFSRTFMLWCNFLRDISLDPLGNHYRVYLRLKKKQKKEEVVD